MSDYGQIYAPDYLRKQSDTQLHLIADMIETNTEHLKNLSLRIEKLELEKSFIIEYLNPVSLSFRNMINTFVGLSESQKQKLINLAQSLKELGSPQQNTTKEDNNG